MLEKPFKKISLLATGDEVVAGDITDANTPHFAREISRCGGVVSHNIQVTDEESDILKALQYLFSHSDAVIVTGGLGPTSDDRTRFAVAKVVGQPLFFDENAWQHIVARLSAFDLEASDSNRQQAQFPQGCEIYPNENGTAFGCHVHWDGKDIFMLPGPPRECWPIFEKHAMPYLERQGYLHQKSIQRWLTLGLIEGEVGPQIDDIIQGSACHSAFRWGYPYLEIKLIAPVGLNTDALVEKIDAHLQGYVVSREKEASAILANKLQQPLQIRVAEDIQLILKTLQHEHLKFESDNDGPDVYAVEFTIEETKKDLNFSAMTLQLSVYKDNHCIYQHKVTVPKRSAEFQDYIKEYFAWQICEFLEFLEAS